MTTTPLRVHRGPSTRDGDRGSVTVLAAVVLLALMACLALVLDGAAKLRAIARADAIAAEASRAALTGLDTRGTTLRLDPAAALHAANTYLEHTGHPGTVTITGPRRVTVTVTLTEPAPVGLFGARYTVTGHATAQLGVGVHTGTP